MQIDIYKLYLQKKTKEYKKFSYAHIPDISTSQFLQKLFETNTDPIFVECKLCHNFLKWIPINQVDNCDSYSLGKKSKFISNL